MKDSMRLTAAHVSLVHRDVPDPGPLPGVEHMTDQDYDDFIEDLMAQRPDGAVQVFSYGSLIWKPVFEPAAIARATALGWHRSFCLRVLRWRGSLDQPGLMMQIDTGGSCEGVIHAIVESGARETLKALLQREMTIKPPSNLPRWIDVEADGRAMRAIAFTANPGSPNYLGPLDPATVAERLASACGQWGSGAEYLHQTVAALEREGIHDPYLWDLQERVARHIEALFPGTLES